MTAHTILTCDGCGQQIDVSGKYMTVTLHQPFSLDHEQIVFHSHRDPACVEELARGIVGSTTTPSAAVPTVDEINRH